MLREQKQDKISGKKIEKLGTRKFWRMLRPGGTMKIFFSLKTG